MGQKVNPISFRLGVSKTSSSKWFSHDKKRYREYLLSDIQLKKVVLGKLKNAGVARCEIERSPQLVKLVIYSSRPGIIIGRNGVGIEELKKELKKKVSKNEKIEINIQEVKNPESNAMLVAQMLAEQIEKRISYRRAMKRALDRSYQSPEVKGIKIMISGRLDGAEIARTEWLAKGMIPLQTLRADIDFAKTEAYTTYGVVGIKVWIYKGEVFEQSQEQENKKILEQ